MRFVSRHCVVFFAAALFLLTLGPAQSAERVTPASGTALSSAGDPLLQLVDDAIYRTTLRYLDVDVHTPWQIMHGVLALRGEYQLKSQGTKVNAIDWISNEARFRGDYWFEKTPSGGRGHPFTVPYAFEGHVNQFLAILTMSNLPPEHQFRVKGGDAVAMEDMVRHAQLHVNTREETTWTLWFLTRYLEPDEQWTNQTGEPWSMERLVSIQTQASVTNAPCGGTHQLFALSLARNSYMLKHGRLTGAWMQADQKLQSHIAAAQSLQNGDGSFSTSYFKGRGVGREFNERIKASGHMLEWLMAALPDRRLKETWVRRAVESVARDLKNNANEPADCGPLYHALHALILYRERVAPPPTVPTEPAELPVAAAEPLPMPVEAVEESGDPATPAVIPPPPPLATGSGDGHTTRIDIDEAQPHGAAAGIPAETPPLPPRENTPRIIPARDPSNR